MEGLERFENNSDLDKQLHALDQICKDIAEGCHISVFLEEGRLVNGEVAGEVPVGETTVLKGFAKTELFFNMTTGFLTVKITFKNPLSTEKSSVYNLYELYLQKSDEFFRSNADRIAHLSFYFQAPDEIHGIASLVDCHNPLIVFQDNSEGSLTCLFDMKAFHYSVQFVDYRAVEEAVQNDIADEVRVEEREERRMEELEEQKKNAANVLNVLDDEDF